MVSGRFAPTLRVAAIGAIVTDAARPVEGVTLRMSVADALPADARSRARPAAIPVTMPVADTVATPGLSLAKAMLEPEIEAPLASLAVACRRVTPPTTIEVSFTDTVIEAITAVPGPVPSPDRAHAAHITSNVPS